MPLGSILHCNNLAVYCLSSKEDQSELEIPSSSSNHHHTLDPELELRIEKGGSQLIDITPVDTALRALPRLPVLTSSPIAQAWTAADTALCLSMAIECALTLGLASILFKVIKGMQESMGKCLSALPQGFKRRQRRGGVKSENLPSLIEMNRGPVRTNCCLTILIHVPSDFVTVQRGPHRNFVGRRGVCSICTLIRTVNKIWNLQNAFSMLDCVINLTSAPAGLRKTSTFDTSVDPLSPITWSSETLPSTNASTNTPPGCLPGCPPGLQYLTRARRTPLIHSAHTSLGTGHPGVNETLSLLKDRFRWPNMASDVRRGSSPVDNSARNPLQKKAISRATEMYFFDGESVVRHVK
ncbi:hypothetical protein DPX16_22262 [Anabarilius grahami]|uniref:Integrase zinc-binding domain-containing protein n=1 Tax=Anabarilius grahami TaxID=495550 RepID=A0A3N0Y101_ANAGA|nr:hypothetical protein DPX16_22262 [Anabarilius grahami]